MEWTETKRESEPLLKNLKKVLKMSVFLVVALSKIYFLYLYIGYMEKLFCYYVENVREILKRDVIICLITSAFCYFY